MDGANLKMYAGTVAFAGTNGVPVMVGAGQSAFAGPGGPLVSADLSPSLPLGVRARAAGGRAALAPSGSFSGAFVGWYGEDYDGK
jgi:hypothetical protein